MAKSLFIAYLLLFVGGIFGLHLLYLRRDMQAFLYWCTLGGYCGICSLRDLFRLPSYVKDINNESEFVSNLAKKMKKNKKPALYPGRFIGEILVGNSWCFVWVAAIPTEEIFGVSLHFLKYLGPIAAALGVWIVGNLGRQKGSLKLAILGALVVLPLTLYDMGLINWSSVTSAILFEWKAKQWRRSPYVQYSLCRRFLNLSFCWFLFCSVWISYIYFNGEITYKDGQTAKLKDAIPNFFRSPMFLEFKKNFWKLLADVRELGFSQAWSNLLELIDPLGEYHALKVLQLKKGATQEEITAQFKKLTKEWHPDRHKDPEKKSLAHEKFVEITDAYEKLSVIKKRRKKKNKITEHGEDDYQTTINI